MALTIENIDVVGFLDSVDIKSKLDQDINFIIGLNGTGKTTLINLIRACLECDSTALISIPFRNITIRFKNTEGRNKPTYSITRTYQQTPYAPVVEYSYREKAGASELHGR